MAPRWRRSSTKVGVGIIGALGAAVAVAAQSFSGSWASAELPTVIFGVGASFLASTYVAVASRGDGIVESELRKQLQNSKSNGYQGAASELGELIQKIQSNIAEWSPEAGRMLREDAIRLARVFLEQIGVEAVRVSYYTPTAPEDRPTSNTGESEDYTALSLVHASCGTGRHYPKDVHVRSESTKHMFEALRSYAPTSPGPRKRVRGKTLSWQSARQVGVRANGDEPIGLLSADSAHRGAFPNQADDVLTLVVQVLLLIERRNI